jgi:hypothetical protein
MLRRSAAAVLSFALCLHGFGTPGPLTTMSAAEAAQGFGAGTPGGGGQPVYTVTSLADSGPGTFRDAVARGNRRVVFDVAGTIHLQSDVRVRGAYLTIDGLTAPSPGITLKNFGLLVFGSDGAHDVIVRGLRIRNSDQDACDTSACDGTGTGVGILVSFDAQNILIDQVSVAHSGNAAVSVTKGAHDVTIANSILLESRNTSNQGLNTIMLISGAQTSPRGGRTRRVSLHRNLIMDGQERMPQVKWSDRGEDAPELTADIRNNVIYGWASSGVTVWRGARANVVGNYLYTPGASTNAQKRGLYVCHEDSVVPQCPGDSYPSWHARAYTAGNVSGAGAAFTDYLNGVGSESGPFAAAPVTTADACTAARSVLASAGARPLDAVDRQYVADVTIGCGAAAPSATPSTSPPPTTTSGRPDLTITSLSFPATVRRNEAFSVRFTLANRGTATAAASVVNLYLSRDRQASSGDLNFRRRHPGTLAAGATQVHAFTATIPSTAAAGTYYVVLVADAESRIGEASESNNSLAVAVTVR